MNANVPLRSMMTYASLNAMLPAMSKGQLIIYHVGSLMYDRLRGDAYATVHGVALAAYESYQRGEVTLMQRKLGPMDYEYIAIRL